MRILLLLFIFISTISSRTLAQDIVPMVQDTIQIKADNYFGFDGYKNYYFCKNNVVIKKSKQATLQFQDLTLGEVTKVDIINPLKIIVFYEKFNIIVILDNQLNEIERINLSARSKMTYINAVGVADQNRIWLHDNISRKIALFDINTKNFQEIGLPINEEIIHYQSDFNYFQWINDSGQWSSIDRYGKITTIAKLELPDRIQIITPNLLVYSKDNALFMVDLIVGNQNKIKIVEKTFGNFFYKDQILSIFTNEGITNYKINLP